MITQADLAYVRTIALRGDVSPVEASRWLVSLADEVEASRLEVEALTVALESAKGQLVDVKMQLGTLLDEYRKRG